LTLVVIATVLVSSCVELLEKLVGQYCVELGLLVDSPCVEVSSCVELVDWLDVLSPAVLVSACVLVLNPTVDGLLVLSPAVELVDSELVLRLTDELGEFSLLVLSFFQVELELDELLLVLLWLVVSAAVELVDCELVLRPAVLVDVDSPSVELVLCELVVSGVVMLLVLCEDAELVELEDSELAELVERLTVLLLDSLEVLLLELLHSAAAQTIACQTAAPAVWSMHVHASPRVLVQIAPVRNGRPTPAVSTVSSFTPGCVVLPGQYPARASQTNM